MSKTCRIYLDTKKEWHLIFYLENSVESFQALHFPDRDSAIAFARKNHFTEFYDGYSMELTKL